MSSEIRHISADAAAFKWALGCVFASYRERIKAMTFAGPPVSRWILALEMLVCFTPLALGFFEIVGYYALLPLRDDVIIVSASALGPVGLAVAFKTIVLNRPSLSRSATWVFAMLAIWTLLAFTLPRMADGRSLLGWWRELTLVGILPTLATAHLIVLSGTKPLLGAPVAQFWRRLAQK
jgi:hypothetical protein